MEKKFADQKEYLKKYLSSGDGEDKKKKKKKKMKVGAKTVKIIDDDIDLKNMRPMEENEFDIFIDAEDAPQIAGVVDERGPVDFSDKRRWKIVADTEGGDLTITSSNKENKRSRKEKNMLDHDLSPRRKQKKPSDDNDLSPPRMSKKQNRTDADSDLSPPRRKSKKHAKKSSESSSDSDSSVNIPTHKVKKKKKRKEKYSDSDLSPPRKSKKHKSDKKLKYGDKHDSDLSPPRRNKKGSDSDLSPPRKARNDSDSDLSPPRRVRRDSDGDLSPPRKKKHKHYDSDLSPPRQSKKHKSSYSDAKYNKHSDFNPEREHRHRSNHSDSRREKDYKHFDKSSKSNRKHYDSDLSPPRRKSKHTENSYRKERSKHDSNRQSESKHRDIDDVDNERRMKKTLDGKTAGLQDARALREETEAHKKREAEQFSKLSKDVTGVGQAVIVRDSKTGRKRNLEAEAAEEREKQKRQAELDEKYAKWGAGLKQVEDREEKLKDDLYEMSKPLARYADDADLDRRLREQEREGDPMLEYIKQKQIKEGKRKPDRPKYEGSYMPNRFGIKPGHRWDGVDRSNGYEKRWFDAQNAKIARQEEAYKWSTSDM
nr:PREDICTED: BUD13 homolog isoform X1 [Megachile rotundata]XP_012136849.1 PREDICTED: BUD13 homolog isoform X1 [Megachile rotundata]XP_012136850.1 PREDICTED: BUD13 homolog isoform X1 [Megachile rotundata]